MTKLTAAILEQVDRNWGAQLDFIGDLVRTPSLRGNEAAAQERVAAEMSDFGLEPELWEIDHEAISDSPGYSPADWSYVGRPNLSAAWRGSGKGGRSLIFNGHIDVVPAAPESFWTRDPWGGEVSGGRMYGRGAADMKSGIAAMVYAVRALREANATVRGDIHLQTVLEEECTGNGTLAALQRGPGADAAIIPEPFGHTMLEAQVGVLWARVRVRGAGAHVLGADKAVNAIVKAGRLIDAVRELELDVNGRTGRPPQFAELQHPLNFNVGTIRGGEWPSSVPSECIFEVRLSAFPGADLAAAQSDFASYLLAVSQRDPWLAKNPPDIAFFGFLAEGCVLERDEPIFASLAQAHRAVTGGAPEYLVSTATTDVRFFNLYHGIPATCYGPLGGALHAPDEWVDLESVRAVTKVLALAALDWCA
ncbi:MAG: ArgE/DapE family deacylase [Trueperaceae bacterium]